MSAIHKADLSRRMDDFLDRRKAPQGFSESPKARADQTDAYLRILMRFAPQGDALNDWWAGFLDRIGERSETWAWPSEKDVAVAAKGGQAAVRGGDGWKPDSVQINLRRLNEGLPIGDDWLWGRKALQLEAAGASREALRLRRVQMAEQMAEVYPPEVVRARLLELKAKHDAARDRVEDIQRGHDAPSIPSKRMFTEAELAGLVE